MPRRGEHTKEELSGLVLDAAESLIAEKGASGLSARAVAKRIGYAPGSIYLVFENLDEVILRVNARTLDRMHGPIERAVAGRAKPVTRLKRAARAYAEFAREHPNLWRLCFEHRLPPDIDGPEWIDRRIQRLVGLIIPPIAEATGAEGKALEGTAQTLWSGVHGICILTLTEKLHLVGGQSTEQLTDSLVENYVRGMAAT